MVKVNISHRERGKTESTDQGKSPMRLKGIGDSITVMLDPKQPMDFLKQELMRIFKPLDHLAANARIVLDAGGGGGHEDLIRDLGEFLKSNYQVGTVTEPQRERASIKDRLRQKEVGGDLYNRRSDVLMMMGRVRSGQKINAKKHFLLLGDVNPGGEIIAGGDILIMGSLRGKALAGQSDNEQALILALDFRPTQVQIGRIVAAGLPEPKHRNAEFAHVYEGRIIVEDYLKAYPFGTLPWPEIR